MDTDTLNINKAGIIKVENITKVKENKLNKKLMKKNNNNINKLIMKVKKNTIKRKKQ